MSEPKSVIEKVEADLAVKEEKEDRKRKNTEKAKYVLFGVLLGLWFVGLLAFAGFRYVQNSMYVGAVKNLEDEKYKEAVATFEKLGNYGSTEYYLEKIYAQLPQYKLMNAKIGESVTYGMYIQEQSIAPIEWNIIDQQDGKVLLLSRHILDAQPYSGEVSLQTWLTDTFSKTAFNNQESAAISEILILNKNQIDTYLEEKEYAQCEPTSYATDNGLFSNYASEYSWWVNEESFSSGKHYVASLYGYVGANVSDDSNKNGVRPAIWVSFE